MLFKRVIAAFLAVCLLLGAWFFVRAFYTRAFCAAANAVFFNLEFGQGGRVSFMKNPSPRGDSYWSAVMWLGYMPTRTSVQVPLSTFGIGYASTVIFLVAAVATPIRRWRKWISIIAGLAVLHSLIALRLWLSVRAGFMAQLEWEVYGHDAASGRIYETIINALVHPPSNAYILPLLVWLLIVVPVWALDKPGPQDNRDTPKEPQNPRAPQPGVQSPASKRRRSASQGR